MIVFCSDNGPVGDDGYKDEALEKMGTIRPMVPSVKPNSVLEGGTRTPLSIGLEKLNRHSEMVYYRFSCQFFCPCQC